MTQGVQPKPGAVESRGRILVVDDEPLVVEVHARILQRQGFEAVSAANGELAIEHLRRSTFDAVVSDISMPGMDGIQLLRAVRDLELDLPVILITALPAIETAAKAVEYGALRYLTKPVEPAALLQAVQYAVQLRRMTQFKREVLALNGVGGVLGGDRAGLESRFDRALDGMWMAFQPIVSWTNRRVFGYEALIRSTEATLPTPMLLLETAERLGRLNDLGRAVRARVAEAMASVEAPAVVFVNAHPQDLLDDHLYDPAQPFSRIADRIVLEVTERASLEAIPNVRGRLLSLREMGFRLAVDDLGAGYAGLCSLIQIEPHVVKFDMALVRGLDTDATKQRLIGSMAKLCGDMGILAVAEGVETVAERDILASLGCDLMQGYLFARPQATIIPPLLER
jgi:EAL domain-containing protein (putative c-di-GMP-specific phosphodiesterase class I)/CheY-like chemotaxis protein